jgi:G3E family GTPase
MADGRKTALALLTGFLGSGKTTVLNDALAGMAGRRVAVVVNEWGKQGVDGSLLLDPAGFGITELAGGQIFCSCVGPAFMAALERLATLDLEAVLVETSGLAKPATLGQLVAEVERRTAGALYFTGLACVVDAVRFRILRGAAMALDEQVAYADRFIVTKADLVDPAALAETLAILKDSRPDAPVTLRSGSPLSPAAVIGDGERRPARAQDPRWRGWGEAGRPRSSTLVPEGAVDRRFLEAFLKELAEASWRIKGFVPIDGVPTPYLVDCVSVGYGAAGNGETGAGDAIDDGGVSLCPAPATAGARQAPVGLTIIWKAAAPESAELSALWERMTGTKAAVRA